MNVLIVKLGATGDVVRTTPLLRRLGRSVTWITADKNLPLLQNLSWPLRVLSWSERDKAIGARYDLVINLEDDRDSSLFLKDADAARTFGAYLDAENRLSYSDDAAAWFDMSLISRFGRAEADRLKLANRSTYQELIFRGLGFAFAGDKYELPPLLPSSLTGDVAISSSAGPVWPMKRWAFYDELQHELEARGYRINVLPTRATLLEHLGDVRGHRCLVSGDSLPMHLALGSGVRCVSIFTCTSPWEIHGYGLQTKIISPRLEEFFYKRGFDERATTAISVEEVLSATLAQLDQATAVTRIAEEVS